jgi:hypothetical protein
MKGPQLSRKSERTAQGREKEKGIKEEANKGQTSVKGKAEAGNGDDSATEGRMSTSGAPISLSIYLYLFLSMKSSSTTISSHLCHC